MVRVGERSEGGRCEADQEAVGKRENIKGDWGRVWDLGIGGQPYSRWESARQILDVTRQVADSRIRVFNATKPTSRSGGNADSRNQESRAIRPDTTKYRHPISDLGRML
jgi:hypothetical protein